MAALQGKQCLGKSQAGAFPPPRGVMFLCSPCQLAMSLCRGHAVVQHMAGGRSRGADQSDQLCIDAYLLLKGARRLTCPDSTASTGVSSVLQ